MTYAQLIRKASKSSALLAKAQEQVDMHRQEMESNAYKALKFVKTVQDAIKVFKISANKETQIFAWKKAVMLLGSTPKDLQDLVSIVKCSYRPTGKEQYESWELGSKMEMILSDLSMEQWYELLMESPGEDLSRKAIEGMAKILGEFQDLKLVEHWEKIMELRETKQKTRHYFFASLFSEFRDARKRLTPVEPEGNK